MDNLVFHDIEILAGFPFNHKEHKGHRERKRYFIFYVFSAFFAVKSMACAEVRVSMADYRDLASPTFERNFSSSSSKSLEKQ
jgi:hypothetical protein